MIDVDQALCTACGVCVDECPTGAITLFNDTVTVDAALCDGCGSFDEPYDRVCVEACPNEALVWVVEPVSEATPQSASLTVFQPSVEIVNADVRKPMRWYRNVAPVVGGALGWVGREIVPRLAPLALNALDSALDHRLSQRRKDSAVWRISTNAPRDRGRKQHRRRRRGRSQASSVRNRHD